jgi:hypothetical protein
VADLRRRQEAGELAEDLDPASVALARYGDQLGRMVRALWAR